jgi:pyrroline-5-carboxylate reductase
MSDKSFGFIGGGRIARNMLGGFKRAGKMPRQIVVSDPNSEVLNNLKAEFPEITIAPNSNKCAAATDLVFVAVHPPAIKEVLSQVAPSLKPAAVVISLAPKVPLKALAEALGGFQRVVRMNPNAPSIVNSGHNPVAFAPVLTAAEKAELSCIFQVLGACPEVPEENIESYAILTAMGPTYLWFQLYELVELGKSFGLSSQAIETGISNMAKGAVTTMFESGLSPAQVMDLVPMKPLGEDEAMIKNLYQSKLTAFYAKLKS